MAGHGVQISTFAPLALRLARLSLVVASVVVIAFALARLFWLFVDGPQSLLASAPVSSTNPASTAMNVDTTILFRASPFRSQSVQIEESIPADEEAPETDLNLVLYGVRTDGDGDGVAFISSEGGEQMRYYRGDAVQGQSGVVVDRIYADGVILSRNGRVERLTTSDHDHVIVAANEAEEDDPGASASASPPYKAGGLGKTKSSNRENTRLNAVESETPATMSASAQLKRSELEALFQWARFDENTANGEDGVTVFPINSTIFSRSGLKARDVVYSISGIQLDADADYSRLLEDLNTTERVEISLLRNNAPVQLTIRVTND